MKVLKFGGSSVGDASAILKVKNIVEHTDQPVLVVVSALRGVTDQLIRMTEQASQGNSAYVAELDALTMRHHQMVVDVIPAQRQGELLEQLDQLLSELRSILHGVCLIQDLTPKISDAIVAYGERLSSLIVAALINGAVHTDSRQFIRTLEQGGKHAADFEETNRLVREHFAERRPCVVMGGFIASDAQTGVTTNLGRGGSDYTAALVAAALDADVLEIWTDVDGFMTADPRIIPNA